MFGKNTQKKNKKRIENGSGAQPAKRILPTDPLQVIYIQNQKYPKMNPSLTASSTVSAERTERPGCVGSEILPAIFSPPPNAAWRVATWSGACAQHDAKSTGVQRATPVGCGWPAGRAGPLAVVTHWPLRPHRPPQARGVKINRVRMEPQTNKRTDTDGSETPRYSLRARPGGTRCVQQVVVRPLARAVRPAMPMPIGKLATRTRRGPSGCKTCKQASTRGSTA